MRGLLRRGVIRSLPAGYDVDTHFKPRYGPWDQRLCLVPDGDLFKAISAGRASMVTDRIERFTPSGIRLESGAELEADVIVTATGLNMLALGGIELTVDGERVSLPERLAYKGMMLSGVPNLAFTIGYTNASWTLKADLVAEYVVPPAGPHGPARLPARGARRRRPAHRAAAADRLRGRLRPALDPPVPAGRRAPPWRLGMNYAQDVVTLRHGGLEDGALKFVWQGPGAAHPVTESSHADIRFRLRNIKPRPPGAAP